MKKVFLLSATLALTVLIVLLSASLSLTASAATPPNEMVIALNQDPDALDPSLGRTYVGRILFANMCEKLYDIDENLNIFPQLAAALPTFTNGGKTVTIKLRAGVKFNDGTPFNADAVAYTLNRHKTMEGSNRKSELQLITNVEAKDDLTVVLTLSEPFSPILGAFVDRSGMPVSPAQAEKTGDKFALNPICVGPWTVTERIPQDRIVLEKSPHYFDTSAASFDKLTFRIIPQDSVRLANLRSGDIDLMHQVSPTDAVAIKNAGVLSTVSATGMGYQAITINMHNTEGKHGPRGDLGTPLANDARVREAFELSIDRDALNQVVFEGAYTPGCTPLSPVSPFYDKSATCLKRDVAKAKSLLAAAGVTTPYALELMVVNNPIGNRVGQVVQSMVAEAGFQVSLRPQEFASALKDYDAGTYTAFQIGWSGRVDPDANIHQFHSCGGSLNQANVCDEDIDALLNEARIESDQAKRVALYKQAVAKMTRERRNIIYLYHNVYIVAFPKTVKGYVGTADGLIRMKGVSKS